MQLTRRRLTGIEMLVCITRSALRHRLQRQKGLMLIGTILLSVALFLTGVSISRSSRNQRNVTIHPTEVWTPTTGNTLIYPENDTILISS